MLLPEYVTIGDIGALQNDLQLTDGLLQRVASNRQYLDDKISAGGTYYGINTGFGSLCDVRVQDHELAQLQENLVCSHACGMGKEVPSEIVKLMMALKILALGKGYSGVRTEVVKRLAYMHSIGMVPVVYELGSLGASGDLAPLAHMCLPLLGKGEVWYNGTKMPTAAALQLAGIEAMPLAAKEGLALLNGTQFMSSYLCTSLVAGIRLARWADVIAAISADAWLVKDEPYQPGIHRIRPHAGQVATAAAMLQLLKGSELHLQHKPQVQDPYSFRCIPQVHGATKDVLATVTAVAETEINGVTDNPIVFHDDDAILSGGNFHGQTLALHADFLAMAMAELANISERRTYLLVSGQRGLPPFLAPEAGLNSGFMIAQYTAAAIVSRNKQLCTPASVDSIVSSNGQEDHVSMGANAVVKLYEVVQHVQRVLGIELLTAAQALEFRRPKKTASGLERIVEHLRSEVPFMATDTVLHNGLIAAERLLDSNPDELMTS